MPKIFVPTIMRKHTENRATVEVPGSTVSEVFENFLTSYPTVRDLLRGTDGRLRPHINVFVNGDDIRGLEGEKTGLTDRDEVHVIPAMAGG
ncbi:MoaD/ThiS family protein [Streptomyces bullii]|uniref:MoaD/ThiS family protein n=1 Tax=Streptomyces bullii TaxID=349910 RepID=A0ABW0USD0_9ACTN